MMPEEAKKKWCPFAAVILAENKARGGVGIMPGYQVAFNRMGADNGPLPPPSASLCLSDGCMLWRWREADVRDEGYCGSGGKEGAP